MAALSQCGPHGDDKIKDTVSKTSKSLKTVGKNPPKDMLYYAQKLAGSSGQVLGEDFNGTPTIFHPGTADAEQALTISTDQLLTDTEEGEEEGEQPTLKC